MGAAFVDAVRQPGSQWARANQNQLLWVLVIVLAGIVGAILYFVIARPALRRVASPGGLADPTSV
ncbi:PLDc N-terminal domain-containing protein [Aeromicrobium duanguangcaii]|uniref:PLDc N-terminal domain-containing protein n=1 Tax=Aeromicrobium duanguangcaii TaxID=2968086 RepID=A0ABY5KHE3_9ACTN|nr:PLDc N-terminal domain-containing protein [Aeromicrobium duanguangcaii]MCD9153494.1 PLDc N-terminal domain-containing protein [Aeromicrobium duanguangcaii]UUI69418.1 PLDc N-terminal domain-containing protein [Aeromicrobium duanguangcaii]